MDSSKTGMNQPCDIFNLQQENGRKKSNLKRSNYESRAATRSSQSSQKEDLDHFGMCVARKLKHMSEEQRIFAEKMIAEIMFYGQLGQLTMSSARNFQVLDSPNTSLKFEKFASEFDKTPSYEQLLPRRELAKRNSPKVCQIRQQYHSRMYEGNKGEMYPSENEYRVETVRICQVCDKTIPNHRPSQSPKRKCSCKKSKSHSRSPSHF